MISVVLFTVFWITPVQILLASITPQLPGCPDALSMSVCVGVDCPLLDVDADMQNTPTANFWTENVCWDLMEPAAQRGLREVCFCQ